VPFCPRTFSRRSAYSQYVQVCIKKVEFDSTEDNDDNISYSDVMDHDDEMLSEVSIMSYEESLRYAEESEDSNEFEEFEESEEPEVFEESEEPEVFEESEEPEVFEPESETYTKFPNDAYKDLMVLVTQHKLNNKAGNAIIKFFNKHSTSPLPKNIEKGRTYINNMKFPNLLFKKICVVHHNNQEYFLHYQDLMQCIKNILATPDITQNLALSYENYEREGESVYKE